MLGLEDDCVRLEPYAPSWAAAFAAESTRLRTEVFTNPAVRIEHIGSTSVPGLSAKPIIDVAVGVDSVEAVLPDRVADLTRVGYTYRGEYGLPGRHFFVLGFPATHHLHLVSCMSTHWHAWLTFRDYLRTHGETRDAYLALKRDLAQRFSGNRHAYTDAKGAFVQTILNRCVVRDPSEPKDA